MHQTEIVERDPEPIGVDAAEIEHDRGGDFLHPLIEERPREVVMVGDIAALLGPEDHRDHVSTEKFAGLVAMLLPPFAPLHRDLAQSDRDLRRAQLAEGRRLENRFADHGASSIPGLWRPKRFPLAIGAQPRHVKPANIRFHVFWAAALRGLRLWMWPLSVPAVGSMTALISAGLPDASASVSALVRLGVSVTW